MKTAVSRITILLKCGDQITAKNPPLNNKTRYMCEANKGHGYQVHWLSYRNTDGFTRDNPAFADMQTKES